MDAALPILARELGFAERHGLRLELVRDMTWATVRDRLLYGHTDAAHMVAPLFFTMAKPFWDGLAADEQKVIADAVKLQSDFADAGIIKTEDEGIDFLKSQGLTVTTPNVQAFREHVQKAFLESDYAKDWPAGLLDRINAV